MIKRIFAAFSVAALALFVGILSFDVQEVEAQADFSGHSVVLTYAEYITDPSSGEAGGIWAYTDAALEVLQRDTGNGQLTGDFVFNDPRAAWDGVPGLSYGVKYGNTSADANLSNQGFWFGESFNTWTNLTCSSLALTENVVSSDTPGLVANFFASGIIDLTLIQADVTQVGFLSPAEFPYFAANPNVLGVAFTLSWVDENREFTDIDNNGKSDVAFRELYYNDAFEWADSADTPAGTIDFPTVAIHEVGHGLSAAHFGTIALQGGELVARPRSVMNAIYGGQFRDLAGRDSASHCSNWAQWGNN